MLLAILKMRDPKWVQSVAKTLGTTVGDISFDDLRDIKFGEFTAKRIGINVEWSFGVCLPLSVDNKRWVAQDYLAYIQARAAKPKVNIKLACDRIHPVTAESILVGLLFSAPFFIALLFALAEPSAVRLILLICATIFLLPGASAIHSNWSYTRLIRRIETLSSQARRPDVQLQK